MERHTYVNTKRSTTKKEYADYKRKSDYPHPYDWWKEDKCKSEKRDFIRSLWDRYPDDETPLVRRIETITYDDGHTEKEVTYNDLVAVLTMIASTGKDLRVSSRKDGIFTEQNITFIGGREATVRNRLEFLDEYAVRLWMEEGDEILNKLLRKDKTHIINGQYRTLCDKVLV